MTEGISTFRELTIPMKITPLNLFIFMLTDETNGVAYEVTVRVGTRDVSIAKIDAASIFSSATELYLDGWKDRYNAFNEEAVLVEFIDADYFDHYRDNTAFDREFPPTPKDWLEANEKDRAVERGVNNLKKGRVRASK